MLALGFLPAALRARDPAIIRDFESRFERLGLPALLLQVLTGVALAHLYLPPREWFAFSGPISSSIAVKLLLLLAILALAVHARLRLIPRLSPQNLPVLGQVLRGKPEIGRAHV